MGFDYSPYSEPFWHRADWQYRFVWWPRQCWITGRWMWLEHAVAGTWVITGPGEPVTETRYLDARQLILLKLKGIVQ
jgi:hypothetical protein